MFILSLKPSKDSSEEVFQHQFPLPTRLKVLMPDWYETQQVNYCRNFTLEPRRRRKVQTVI